MRLSVTAIFGIDQYFGRCQVFWVFQVLKIILNKGNVKFALGAKITYSFV